MGSCTADAAQGIEFCGSFQLKDPALLQLAVLTGLQELTVMTTGHGYGITSKVGMMQLALLASAPMFFGVGFVSRQLHVLDWCRYAPGTCLAHLLVPVHCSGQF